MFWHILIPFLQHSIQSSVESPWFPSFHPIYSPRSGQVLFVLVLGSGSVFFLGHFPCLPRLSGVRLTPCSTWSACVHGRQVARCDLSHSLFSSPGQSFNRGVELYPTKDGSPETVHVSNASISIRL